MVSKKKKVFRIKDEVGPDYKCHICGLAGYRLWRDSYAMLDNITLYCAVCAEDKHKPATFDDEPDGVRYSIGGLVPARPTPDGDTFWGHLAGDTHWWYRLPQYLCADREEELVRRERDMFCQFYEEYAQKYMNERRMRVQAEEDRAEALRFAKLDGIPL